MRYKDIIEDGRIVKGVNTTVDVGPNEITKQAKKLGFKVDRDGRPPSLSKKIKGGSANVAFNLGLTEKYDRKHGHDTFGHVEKHKDSNGKAVWSVYNANSKIVKTFYSEKSASDYAEKNHDALMSNKLKANEANEIASSTEIYVDMDGVLADFFTEWGKIMGVDNWWEIDKKHNIDDALQKIRDTDKFWLELPLTSNAKNLLNLIKNIKGSYNILSSPLPGDKNSTPHKLQWIKKNLSFFPPSKVLIRHDKDTFATQDDGTPNILIDDYGVNVAKWNAAGGVGFKHKDHKFERTAKAIKKHIEEPVGETKEAPPGTYFTKTGNLVKGRLTKSAKERGARETDPKDNTRSKVPPVTQHNESMDNPYPIDWDYLKPTEGSSAKAKLDDGSILDISISDAGVGQYDIEFTRGGTMKPTGGGDEFRIFATVKSAIAQWWNQLDKSRTKEIFFSASKADGGRGRLYKRFVSQWADHVGWEFDSNLSGDTETYGIINPQMSENFADGKKKGKSRPGRVKKSGASCKGSVTSLRKKAKNASGERAKMYHWCANMKSGKKK